MAIVHSVFAQHYYGGQPVEFWLKANDNTMKIVRGGVDNQSDRSVVIRLEDTQEQQAWEVTVAPHSSLDQNIGGLNLDAVDIGDGTLLPPDHVNLISRGV